MRYPLLAAVALITMQTGLAHAQSGSAKSPAPPPPPPSAQGESGNAAFSALTVPALKIASHPDLVIEGVDIAVSLAQVTTTYRLRNKASADLRLAASVDLPKLSASSDSSEAYRVNENAENFVDLKISADGAPVNAKPEVRVFALDLDRTSELKASNLPLLPFGDRSDKALAALSPEQVSRLVALGLIAPPEPAQGNQPALPPIADWTLSVTYGWEQVVPAQKTVTIAVSSKPAAGSSELSKENAGDLDDLKDEVCLQPATIKALKTKAQAKNAAPLPVAEIVLDNPNPARWLAAPAATVTVDKPSADVVVAFCGTDMKSPTPTRVTARTSEEADSVRILLIGAAVK